MIPTTRATPVLLSISLITAACDARPQADEASKAVIAHLEAVAPMAIVEDSFDVIEASVSGDTAHIRTVWAFTDTSGTWVDTSAVLGARLARDGEVWRVSGYDSMLAAHVFQLVDEDRRRRYQDLLDNVHHVYHAVVEAGWYGAPAIDADSLRARVATFGHAVDAPWGITPHEPGAAQVIWLADAQDTEAMCALPVTQGEGRPTEWEWVQDDEFFTCRGRTPQVYSRASLPLEVRDAMQSAGVMPAAPPPLAPGGASHHHD